MGFLNTNSMPRLVEKLSDGSNIKITGNSKGNRVGTVIDKIVEKADDVTKAIEQEVVNEGYSFKVGTGDVDVSSDVQDGFGEVGIKGVTYQNLFNDTTSVVNGVYDINTKEFTNTSNEWFRIAKTGLLKQNTTYTLIFLYKSTVDKINVRAEFDLPINNSSSICKNFGDISATTTYQQFKKTFSTNGNVDILRLLIRNCYDGTVSIKYPVILEGDHTSNLNLPSYFEGIVGVGDKSKNLFNPNNLKQTVLDLGKKGQECIEKNSNTRCSIRSIPCKPNTKYTLKSDKDIYIALGSIGSDNITLGDSGWKIAKDGFTYTTPSNAVELAMNFKNESNTNITPDDVRAINIQLQEGENADTYQPYGTHKIEILSNGKNLLNPNNATKDNVVNPESDNLVISGNYGGGWMPLYKNLNLPQGYYCLQIDILEGTYQGGNIGVKDLSGNLMHQSKFPNSKIIVNCKQGISELCVWACKGNCKIRVFLCRVDSANSPFPTPYEYYKEDKTQILLDEPLMKLPNGVCDEITRDGKLIKRTYKFKLNRESLNNFVHIWGYQNATTDYIRFYRYMKDTNLPRFSRFSNGNGLCNLISTNANGYLQEKETFGVGGSEENLYISFSISSDKIPNFDFDNYGSVENRNLILDYLDKNNYEIYYELETPMITELSAPSLRIFKDGHLTFNTLVAPTSTHLVQLNKSAQIERSIREVQSLDSRVGKLESFYDDMILETSHKLNLLNYDFDYMRNMEEEI